MNDDALNAIDKHIGARLRMRRTQLGISQSSIGEKLGLSFQQIQKYEKGLNRIGGSRMAQIAELLQVDVGFFYLNAPGTGAPHNAEACIMDDFMASKDGLIIAEAFVLIADPAVRHAVATAISQIGRALAPKQVTLMAAE